MLLRSLALLFGILLLVSACDDDGGGYEANQVKAEEVETTN
jgi:hypothetical protein